MEAGSEGAMPVTIHEAWPRRRALHFLSLVGAVLASGRFAWAAEDANTTKGAAWLLGDKLSLAALLYNQGGNASAMVDDILAKAKTVADILGVEVKPFPAKATKSAEASADIIHYLIQGEGADIGIVLAKKYNQEHGVLFEVAVKSNLLILLYGPEDNIGQSIATVVKSRMEGIRMPPRLWQDVVRLVTTRRPQQAVKDAVFKMHKDIANFYIPGSG
jgi:hypothetical protein